MVDFNINTYNLNDVIASNTNFLTLYWGVDMPQLEKSRDFESRYTGVYYNFSNNDVEHLSLTGDEKVDLPTSVKWGLTNNNSFPPYLSQKSHSRTCWSPRPTTQPQAFENGRCRNFIALLRESH